LNLKLSVNFFKLRESIVRDCWHDYGYAWRNWTIWPYCISMRILMKGIGN